MSDFAFWFFFILTAFSGFWMSIVSQIRYVVLWGWLVGFGVGGILFSMGGEFLAFFQWLMATLVAIMCFFHLIIFNPEVKKVKQSNWLYFTLIVFTVGSLVLFFGVDWPLGFQRSLASLDIHQLGEALYLEYALEIGLLTFLFLMLVIGAGLMMRIKDRSE